MFNTDGDLYWATEQEALEEGDDDDAPIFFWWVGTPGTVPYPVRVGVPVRVPVPVIL